MCLRFLSKKTKHKSVKELIDYNENGCRMIVLVQNIDNIHFSPRQCGNEIHKDGFCKIHYEAYNCLNKNF